MTTTTEIISKHLYSSIKQIITQTPVCPDGVGLACPSCLASALCSALNDPSGSPLESVVGDIPIFTAKDVQALLNAAVRIDRQECHHESCGRNDGTSVLLLPV